MFTKEIASEEVVPNGPAFTTYVEIKPGEYSDSDVLSFYTVFENDITSFTTTYKYSGEIDQLKSDLSNYNSNTFLNLYAWVTNKSLNETMSKIKGDKVKGAIAYATIKNIAVVFDSIKETIKQYLMSNDFLEFVHEGYAKFFEENREITTIQRSFNEFSREALAKFGVTGRVIEQIRDSLMTVVYEPIKVEKSIRVVAKDLDVDIEVNEEAIADIRRKFDKDYIGKTKGILIRPIFHSTVTFDVTVMYDNNGDVSDLFTEHVVLSSDTERQNKESMSALLWLTRKSVGVYDVDIDDATASMASEIERVLVEAKREITEKFDRTWEPILRIVSKAAGVDIDKYDEIVEMLEENPLLDVDIDAWTRTLINIDQVGEINKKKVVDFLDRMLKILGSRYVQ